MPAPTPVARPASRRPPRCGGLLFRRRSL